MGRLNELMRTINILEKILGLQYREKNNEKFEKNRGIWASVIKYLEFCGRQGIGLRSHRDSNTNSGDNTLRKHLDAGKRNAMYTSKTT